MDCSAPAEPPIDASHRVVASTNEPSPTMKPGAEPALISVVLVRPSGSTILVRTSSAHEWPVTCWMISPSTM